MNATRGRGEEGGRARREKTRGGKSRWKIRRVKKRRDTLDLRVARAVDFVSSPDRVICETFRNRSFPLSRAQGDRLQIKISREKSIYFLAYVYDYSFNCQLRVFQEAVSEVIQKYFFNRNIGKFVSF